MYEHDKSNREKAWGRLSTVKPNKICFYSKQTLINVWLTKKVRDGRLLREGTDLENV